MELERILEYIIGNGLIQGSTTVFVSLLFVSLIWKFIKWSGPKIWEWLKRRYTVSVTIEDKQMLHWINAWMGRLEYSRLQKNVDANLHEDFNEEDSSVPSSGADKLDKEKIYFTPNGNRHLIRFGASFLLFEHDVDTSHSKSDFNDIIRLISSKSLKITKLGRNIDKLKKLIKDIVDQETKSYTDTIKVQLTTQYGEWGYTRFMAKRPLDSVILDSNIKSDLVDDIQKFFDREDWYNNLGIPHRRGYLFKGSPGTGKSSLAKAIASHFDMPLYSLGLSSKDLDDTKLMALFSSISSPSVVLVEDIDAAFVGRSSENGNHVTFSGLLNAVDGVTSADGRILILTTNHPEKLDEALIRSGRVDKILEFENVTKNQAREMFLRFYPDEEILADILHSKIETGVYSPADLQEIFIKNDLDPTEAVEQITNIRS